jgi:hypothetical protein
MNLTHDKQCEANSEACGCESRHALSQKLEQKNRLIGILSATILEGFIHLPRTEEDVEKVLNELREDLTYFIKEELKKQE